MSSHGPVSGPLAALGGLALLVFGFGALAVWASHLHDALDLSLTSAGAIVLSMRRTPCFQCGSARPRVAWSLRVSSREFRGRLAGVG